MSSTGPESRPDPRDRPPDPAGTQPKVDQGSLLPARRDGFAALGTGQRELELGGTSLARPSGHGNGGGVAVAATPAGPSPFAPRFQFVKGALGALAAVAVAVAVGVLAAPGSPRAPAWSPWQPAGSDVDPAEQIAGHVAPEYKLDTGQPIVRVTGGPPTLDGQPMILAINSSGAQPSALPGNGVVYELCGDGTSCSISEGAASVQRGLLLRREALELALYTFRYVGGVNEVVVTIPSPPPSKSSSSSSANNALGTSGSTGGSSGTSSSGTTTLNRALLFRPQDLGIELDRPLAQTLPGPTPTVSTMDRSFNAGLVNQLTGPELYDYTIIQQSQSNPVLLLAPAGLGG